MKIFTLHRRIIGKVNKELYNKFNVDYTMQELNKVYQDYIRTLRHLMSLGKLPNPDTFIKRIEVKGLGFFVASNGALYSRVNYGNKNNKFFTADNQHIVKEVHSEGWRLVGYIRKRGWMFFNEDKQYAYIMTNEPVINTYTAYLYFREIMKTDYVLKGYYVCLYDEIKDANIIGGFIKAYDKNGNLLRSYCCLKEVFKDFPLPDSYIHEVLLYNYENNKTPKHLRGEYLFFDNGNNIKRSFRSKLRERKHHTVLDIISAKTGKTLLERYGDATDVAELINAYHRNVEIKGNNIHYIFKNNRSYYGFKFKESAIQLSKFEEDRIRKEAAKKEKLCRSSRKKH